MNQLQKRHSYFLEDHKFIHLTEYFNDKKTLCGEYYTFDSKVTDRLGNTIREFCIYCKIKNQRG